LYREGQNLLPRLRRSGQQKMAGHRGAIGNRKQNQTTEEKEKLEEGKKKIADRLEDAAVSCQNSPLLTQKGGDRDGEDEEFEASLNEAERPGVADDGADSRVGESEGGSRIPAGSGGVARVGPGGLDVRIVGLWDWVVGDEVP
jgi:hypothetical protein